jgi:hypothetical protein
VFFGQELKVVQCKVPFLIFVTSFLNTHIFIGEVLGALGEAIPMPLASWSKPQNHLIYF